MVVLVVRKVRDAFLDLLALITATGTTGMEWQSSTTLLALAVFAYDPWTNFIDTVPFQHELLSLMPEPVWGALFLVLGAAQSWANLKRHSRERMVCAFLAASTFGCLSILALLVQPVSLFLPVFFAAAGAQAICFLVMSLARFRAKKSSGTFQKVRLNANA